jgi:hypothetical protein
MLVGRFTPSAEKPMDHEKHHLFPTKNFALYFTWWVPGWQDL